MYIRLSDTDRKALGLDEEWTYWENARFTNREARLIERLEPDGPGLSPEDWIEAMRGEPVERNGVPVLDEETGEPERRPSALAIDVLIWLMLRRVGKDIVWDDLEYDRNGYAINSVPGFPETADDGEPGKGDPEPGEWQGERGPELTEIPTTN